MKIIEKEKRLKDSVLWELQNKAYTQFGPEAWADKGVPFYLTSNPLIAKQFSEVILGYIRDCLRTDSPTPLNLSAPLYIFDLGAGSGRLGYLVLKHLLPLLETAFSEKISICYVMTDIAESNIAFWEEHPLLGEYIESGVLDFAYYHHANQDSIKLLKSGKILTQETVINPVILICTYFFDTIPQDLFRAKKGHIEEGRITISVPEEENLDPSLIMKLEAGYDYFPVNNPESYYSDRPELNDLLLEYAKLFDNTPFLFPIGGFEAIQYFSQLSQGRMLLLSGDQGVATEQQIREWGEPKISKHASFSIAVDYHCLAHYFRNQGGAGMLTSSPNTKFVVMSAILGGSSEVFPKTALAFRENIDALEPVKYWEMTNFTPEQLEEMLLEDILSYVELGNWDPINFHLFFDAIRKKASNATADQKDYLCQVIHKVWENFYPIGPKEMGFVMNLGVLFFEMKKHEEALLFFQRALDLGGESADLLMNMARCYKALGNKTSAAKYFQRGISFKVNLEKERGKW